MVPLSVLLYTRWLPTKTMLWFKGSMTIGVFQLYRSAWRKPDDPEKEPPPSVDLRGPDLSQHHCHSAKMTFGSVGSTTHWNPSPPRMECHPDGEPAVINVKLSCAPPRSRCGFDGSTVPA